MRAHTSELHVIRRAATLWLHGDFAPGLSNQEYSDLLHDLADALGVAYGDVEGMPEPTVADRLNMIAESVTTLAFDGCHKIYILRTPADMEDARVSGYNDDDFFPSSEIHALWQESCGLRFVSEWSLEDSRLVIGQEEYE